MKSFVVQALSLLVIILAATPLWAEPMPRQLAINPATKDCFIYWPGDEHVSFELKEASSWQLYQRGWKTEFQTPYGNCEADEITMAACCEQLGFKLMTETEVKTAVTRRNLDKTVTPLPVESATPAPSMKPPTVIAPVASPPKLVANEPTGLNILALLSWLPRLLALAAAIGLLIGLTKLLRARTNAPGGKIFLLVVGLLITIVSLLLFEKRIHWAPPGIAKGLRLLDRKDHPPTGSEYGYEKIYFSQDGKYVIGIEHLNKGFSTWQVATGNVIHRLQIDDCGDSFEIPGQDAFLCFYVGEGIPPEKRKIQKVDPLQGTITRLKGSGPLGVRPEKLISENLWFYFERDKKQISLWDVGGNKFIYQQELPLTLTEKDPTQFIWSEDSAVALFHSGIHWTKSEFFFITTMSGKFITLPGENTTEWALTQNRALLSRDQKAVFKVLPDGSLQPVLPPTEEKINFSRLQNLQEDFISELNGLAKVHFDLITGFAAQNLYPAPPAQTYEFRFLSPDSNWVVRYGLVDGKTQVSQLGGAMNLELKSQYLPKDMQTPALLFSRDSKYLLMSYKRRVDVWDLSATKLEPVLFDLPDQDF